MNRTTNIVAFFHPVKILESMPEIAETAQAAYRSTAAEDALLGMHMDSGREALFKEGRDEVGPYQSPRADGMPRFHAFVRAALEGHV